MAEHSRICLPEIFTIGFSGHRKLADEALCREAIHTLLAEQKAIPGRMVCAVASVAAGGDLLFTESCLELGIPLQVLLPFAPAEFRKDFDPPMWERAERVMAAALSVTVTGNEEDRTARYYECGIETVQQAQMLVALWNGQPAAGLGGTQDIVDFATQMGKPVLWIQSETGAFQTIPVKPAREQAGYEAKELRFLNQLPSAGALLPDAAPATLAQAWLAKLDANATLVAPQVRRLAAVPIVCTALAATLTASAPHMDGIAVWSALGAVLGLTAALLPTALRLGKRQALWVRIRTAAEITRSVLALWETPVPYRLAGQEVLPELSEMIRSLNFLKAKASLGRKDDIAAFKKRYLEDRVVDQMHYFSRQVDKAAKQGRKYRRVSKASIGLAIVASLWTLGGRRLLPPHSPFAGGSWLSLLSSALFQAATIAGALLVVYDCDRRERRYRQLHRTLGTFEAELAAFRTWPPVVEVVSKIERTLLVELLEWRSLLQNMKMPRN